MTLGFSRPVAKTMPRSWTQALQVLGELRDLRCEANVVTYRSLALNGESLHGTFYVSVGEVGEFGKIVWMDVLVGYSYGHLSVMRTNKTPFIYNV